jgi:2-polyprenyl-6-methoxyphenol hydroxylase-like FAD-dependent oxidoreductase
MTRLTFNGAFDPVWSPDGRQPCAPPALVVEEKGRVETIAARLVVGAEGRSSVVRSSARFPLLRDPEDMMIAGVLFENVPAVEDTGELIYHFGLGQFVGVFPQGGGRVRMYLSYHAGTQPRFQGHTDLARFIQGCQNTGANPVYFKDARPIGPLATFDAKHTWVDHPYRDGLALLGDAATSSDPSWGQGLSLTLRDARVLRDHFAVLPGLGRRRPRLCCRARWLLQPVAHFQPVVR